VGAALHNVAIANLRAGSLDDAMDAIEEAIKIRSRALGRGHSRVAVRVMEFCWFVWYSEVSLTHTYRIHW
jgi:hypothetical protein